MVAFRNKDIYMVNSAESDPYKEPQERNVRVLYKLKVNEDPASKHMPHEEEFDDEHFQVNRRERNSSVKIPHP